MPLAEAVCPVESPRRHLVEALGWTLNATALQGCTQPTTRRLPGRTLKPEAAFLGLGNGVLRSLPSSSGEGGWVEQVAVALVVLPPPLAHALLSLIHI